MSLIRARGLVLLLAVAARADEPDYRCPIYDAPQRLDDQAHISRQLEFQRLSRSKPKNAPRAAAAAPPSANFVDDYVFGKIAADGIPLADMSTDQEFVRRIYIDLTGHIPTAEQITAFLGSDNPDKRNALINSLLGSPAYVDRWTQWFGDRFKVGSNYYNFVSITSRNLFYNYVRDLVERDRPYNEFAAQVIAAGGDSLTNGPVNYLVRSYESGPIQDVWDGMTNFITTSFLGVQTQCISCHDGRRHLEPINLYLSVRHRSDFWRQSAFLSRLRFSVQSVNAYGVSMHLSLSDAGPGGYTTTVPSNNPGQRPTRIGGPYSPSYIFTGAEPSSKEWRTELANLITSDRQFARAAVNYVWAKLFTMGIVDPPDNWDLARIDPANAPAPESGFGLQPSNPELMEALATEFIRSGYSIRHMIELMTKSNAYQLSSRPPGGWRDGYAPYFAKHIPRRLTAEEIFDAVNLATGTETPMFVEGFDKPLRYATQLPDTTEPRSDSNITYFLSQFGRGDWFNSPRNSTSTILQVLFEMNDNQVVARTLASRDGSRSTRVATLLASNMSESEMVEQLFLSTLGRRATDEETAVMQRNRSTRVSREDWLADLQWVLGSPGTELEFAL